ncbi:MAG: methionyl-tRNA formyltransferase, partial [Planctomycetota bacterium]
NGFSLEFPSDINEPSSVEMLKNLDADLMVVCDYGQILKPDALAATRWGGINLHGSLLPSYRGAAPVQRALLSGDTETGATVIHMTPHLDAGPSISVVKTPIRDDETAGQLEARLSELGVQATLDAMDQLSRWDGKEVLGVVQDAGQVSRAPRLSKAEARIDWGRSCRLIDCHVRGMQPWPVAFSHYVSTEGAKPVRVQIRKLRTTDLAVPNGSAVGTLVSPSEGTKRDRLLVVAGDGVLEVLEIQPAGKKLMTAEAFLNGYQPPPEAKFEPQ